MNITTELPNRPRPVRKPRRFRRTLLSSRWLHNWISVFIGVVLVAWVISGLIMLLPVSDVARAGGIVPTKIDWAAMTISPGRAAEIAATSGSGEARSVDIKRLAGRMAYVVRLDPKGIVLVDGATGAVITVTDTLAKVIAAEGVPAGIGGIANVQRVEGGTASEYRGPYPAWKVTFNDATRTHAWVHIPTGDSRKTTSSDRSKIAWGHDLHLFFPLKFLAGGESSRLGALWIASIFSLISMAFGYWLALPARWRAKARV